MTIAGIEGLERYREVLKLEMQSQFGAIMRAQKQQVGLSLFTKLSDGTPVDIGDARKGWHFSSPRPSNEDKAPSDPFSDLVSITNESAAEDPLYIQNNTDHIRVLDDGLFSPPNPGPSSDPRPGRTGVVLVQNGYSLQAPHGISGDALDAVSAEFGLSRGVSQG